MILVSGQAQGTRCSSLCLMLESICDTDWSQLVPVPGHPTQCIPVIQMLFLAEIIIPREAAGLVNATLVSKAVWLMMEQASLHPRTGFPQSQQCP
jgi:hypothetical protein